MKTMMIKRWNYRPFLQGRYAQGSNFQRFNTLYSLQVCDFRSVFRRTRNSYHNDEDHWQWRGSPTEWNLYLSFTAIISCSLHFVSTTQSEPSITQNRQGIDDATYDYLLSELKERLKPEQIELDIEECKLRAKPWNSYHRLDKFPRAVVYPETTEDVSFVVKTCNKYRIPIIPFGGGTSIEGQTLTPFEGISLDFANMKNIIEFHEEDLDITVQAGMGYIELNENLKKMCHEDSPLWFPLDPGPGATVGGMCACRCSGSTAVRYGSMRENVLSLTAVLADGTIIKTGSRARKSSAGYDITRLLIGSEGTLAIITEATLKLHGVPKVSHALRISFPNGVYDASLTSKGTLNCGVSIGRCELLDEEMVKIINQVNPVNPLGLGPWPECTTLLYELTGVSEDAVAEQIQIVSDIAKKNGGTDLYIAKSAEETKQFWKYRKEALWSAMSQFPDRDPMITDVCVPLTQLADLISETKKEIAKITLPCPIIAHAGDGNFHVLIFFKNSDPEEVATAKNLATWMAEKAISLGGTCTGEHGIGTGKKELLKKELGPGSIHLLKTIKTAMDPANIMNPGKVIDLEEEDCGCGGHDKKL